MGKSSAPDPPDYAGAARQEGAASQALSQQQIAASRPDQFNPWGSTRWSTYRGTDPMSGDPTTMWRQHSFVDPEVKSAIDAQLSAQRQKAELGQGMMGRVSEEFGQPMDWGQYGELQGLDYESGLGDLEVPGGQYESGLGGIDPNQFRQQASDAMYSQATSRLDPRFAQQGEAIEVKLRNQGLRPGDQAYDAAMGNFGREKTDAYGQAQSQAMLAGRGEAEQMYQQQVGLEGQRYGQFMGQQGLEGQRLQQQMGLEGQRLGQAQTMANYANQLRQSGMAEEMQKRGYSLNEINAIMSGQQVGVPGMPSFAGGGGAGQAPDYLGAAGMQQQGAMTEFGIGQQQQQSNMQGAASAAMIAASMMSDRRLKRFIHRIGSYLGYPLYVFQYIWGDVAIGVMSDEVNPEAVITLDSGYEMVNCRKLIPLYKNAGSV